MIGSLCFWLLFVEGGGGGGVPYFPTLNFKTHHFVYFTITEEAMLLLVLFYILFVLFFVTVVAVSRPCHLLEFYLNRASTSHGIALFYIRNYSPPPPISHSSSHLACIAGGILVPGVLSRRRHKAKRSEEPQGKVHWLYTHSPWGSAAKTIQHSPANPTGYAGYM